ncbi:polyprenyl synthetase family protein [Streptomyces sp. AP-93]|uniref:polyprenyl synthetase family protein n=1 Tax=Streptomyces sp. AP-93 TaxID=2929048 RepID=UPI001FAECFA4|nr:polyprenyl synthetase family protein [Streptomyces sp. AP-93]MCJ0873239.1 polyprenyl synthetase family protein [Streptomyces sp. AP-93]
MSVEVLDGPGLEIRGLRQAVDDRLAGFFYDKRGDLDGAAVLPEEATEVLGRFVLSGGKRVRPLFCLLGWYAAGRSGPAPGPVLGVAASLEMFHAFALIHDDVMDASATRRGAPALHRVLAARHAEGLREGRAEQMGVGAAVLIGDLALAWSDELVHTAGLTPQRLAAVLALVDTMRTEVMAGQYLDVTGTGRLSGDLERALTIARYKTAKYTCERPLHIGATLADADEGLLRACTAFSVPLGEAFQLRDDVLGVFGDPARTGKPVIDDLRDGKNTSLMALAVQRAEPRQLADLRVLVGDPGLDEEGAGRIRKIIVATGALESVEEMISVRSGQAARALDAAPFSLPAADMLRQLAESVTARAE